MARRPAAQMLLLQTVSENLMETKVRVAFIEICVRHYVHRALHRRRGGEDRDATEVVRTETRSVTATYY